MEGDRPDSSNNYSGIPEAVFLDNVDEFMNLSENSGGVEKPLKELDEQHAKYKFMEYTLIAKRRRLRYQIPELSRTLQMIELLKAQENEIETQFLLNAQVYLKANIPPTKTVCLWLGANVMLEYPLEEAEKLLLTNITTAEDHLARVDHDLDFLRDQWTTVEVNMARLYNWDVKRRQAVKASKK